MKPNKEVVVYFEGEENSWTIDLSLLPFMGKAQCELIDSIEHFLTPNEGGEEQWEVQVFYPLNSGKKSRSCNIPDGMISYIRTGILLRARKFYEKVGSRNLICFVTSLLVLFITGIFTSNFFVLTPLLIFSLYCLALKVLIYGRMNKITKRLRLEFFLNSLTPYYQQ